MKPCKITAHSDKHSDDIFLRKIRVVRMTWNFVRFSRKRKSKICWKFQISILTNKKVLSVPCTMDSCFFSQQMAPWRPNFDPNYNVELCRAVSKIGLLQRGLVSRISPKFLFHFTLKVCRLYLIVCTPSLYHLVVFSELEMEVCINMPDDNGIL